MMKKETDISFRVQVLLSSPNFNLNIHSIVLPWLKNWSGTRSRFASKLRPNCSLYPW